MSLCCRRRTGTPAHKLDKGDLKKNLLKRNQFFEQEPTALPSNVWKLCGSNTEAHTESLWPLDVPGKVPSIAFLTTYFGTLPAWFPLTLKTMAANTTVDFYFFVDGSIDHLLPVPENIHFVPMTGEEFRRQASSKLGYHLPEWESPSKLCDFKFVLGHIFEDILLKNHFDYWGWCDIDLLFGNIRSFLTPEVLKSHHVVTASPAHPVHGPFTIMRTSLRFIYLQIPNIQRSLSNPTWLAVDEQINHPGENIVDLVVQLAAAGLVKVWHHKIAATDATMHPAGTMKGTVQWKDGNLYQIVPGDDPLEVFYYHFQHSKDVVKQTYNSLLLDASHITLDPRTGFLGSAYFGPQGTG